ncbi:MAG: hypothetical protein WBV47_09180 [Salegentibacter sp.]
MRTTPFLVMLLIGLISCNTGQKENEQDLKTANSIQEEISVNKEVEQNTAADSRGYELLKQKCYICHFEKPDPSKRDQMIAPPMLQIQEHYKPTYPNKEDFVNAIMAIVKNPSAEKTLMPGAVKKFNLMPKLIYDDAELRLIAETIYEYDFGSAPNIKMQMVGGRLQLDHGKKWVLKKESMDQINAVIKKISNFESTEISDYNQLGKDIFNDAKVLILDDSYTGELFNQIHIFFYGIENNMHTLIATKSKAEAEKQVTELKNQFKEFHNYFE